MHEYQADKSTKPDPPHNGPTGRLRVAIISHGHPELSHGGAEQASYAQFLALKNCSEIDPVYVARSTPSALGHAGAFASFRGRSDEILWSPPDTNPFRLVSIAPDSLRRNLFDLYAHIAPDIVHLHHIAGFGTDICRSLLEGQGPLTVLTLHEYMAICHNRGQMVKTSGQLCHESSFSECSACFPGISAGKFFLRRQMILENFEHIAAFIAPSEFLRERYIAWGLDSTRIRTIENPLSASHSVVMRSPARTSPYGKLLRLGYFGQLTPFKGVDVLLDAIALLEPETKRRIKLTLFGIDLSRTTSAFAAQITQKIESLKGNVVNHGPYRNEDVMELMNSVDWIVVPSIWWENSPVVIQEAKAAGVPVLCSNIGGMREKIRCGVDGAHFGVGNAVHLADRIADIAVGRLIANLRPQPSSPSPIDVLLSCYRELLSRTKAKNVDQIAPENRVQALTDV